MLTAQEISPCVLCWCSQVMLLSGCLSVMGSYHGWGDQTQLLLNFWNNPAIVRNWYLFLLPMHAGYEDSVMKRIILLSPLQPDSCCKGSVSLHAVSTYTRTRWSNLECFIPHQQPSLLDEEWRKNTVFIPISIDDLCFGHSINVKLLDLVCSN